jgi:hypothetical protein
MAYRADQEPAGQVSRGLRNKAAKNGNSGNSEKTVKIIENP